MNEVNNNQWMKGFLMLHTHNSFFTSEEIRNDVSSIDKVRCIKTFRYPYQDKIYHLSFSLVSFDSYSVFERASVLEKFSYLDKFYFEGNVALIFGLPSYNDFMYYSKMLTNLMADEVRMIENADQENDFIIVAGFDTHDKLLSFKNKMDGAYFDGNKLKVIEFVPNEIQEFRTGLKYFEDTLNTENNLDFILIYYGKEYKVWSGSVIASSEAIMEYFMQNGEDTNEFIIPNIKGPFHLFVDYFNGKTIQINDENAVFVMLMSKVLKINELFDKSERFVSKCCYLHSNVILLRELFRLNGDFSDKLKIVASSFGEKLLDSIEVKKYPVKLLGLIISSPFFSMTDDALFEYILQFKITNKSKYLRLLKQIRTEKLSNGNLQKLKESDNKENSNKDSSSIDKQKILIDKNGTRYTFFSLFTDIVCNFQDDGSNDCFFHGIFNYIRKLVGGNPYAGNAVKLTASSYSHSTLGIILEPNSNDWFGTQDMANSYIVIDFIKRKVSLTGYTLQTHAHQGNGHIVGWCLQGSNDGSTWNLIDNVPSCSYFSQNLGGKKYFPVAPKTIYYQYFKIQQTAKNSMNYYNLRLSCIEFFGTLTVE